MKIAIISGGSIQREFASGFLSQLKPDRIIAADRGLAFCAETGLLPDLAVGDFDSLPGALAGKYLPQTESGGQDISGERRNDTAFRNAPDIQNVPDFRESLEGAGSVTVGGKVIRVIRHRPEKDATDTELAVSEAAALGAREVYLLGATGTRLDHVWGNIGLLYRLRQQGIRAWIVDAHNRIFMPAEKKVILSRENQFGKYVSILPYGGPVRGITLEGFHYPLKEYTLFPGDESLCVSNEIEAETAVIHYREGVPVIIESRD